MSNFEELNLLDLANGKAVDQVNHQLREVVKNCLDPNTDATGARKVNLSIMIKPTADREKAEITFKVEAKLRGDAPGLDTLHFALTTGKGYVNKAEQMSLDDIVSKDGEEITDSAGVVVGMGKTGGES